MRFFSAVKMSPSPNTIAIDPSLHPVIIKAISQAKDEFGSLIFSSKKDFVNAAVRRLLKELEDQGKIKVST